MQQTKKATGQSTYTFTSNLNHYELSDSSSDEDDEEVNEAAKGITQTTEAGSKYDYFKENMRDPETRAALINALSDSEESGSEDEQPSKKRQQEELQLELEKQMIA